MKERTPFEGLLEEQIEPNGFERRFRFFIIYPGVIFAFVAGAYYVLYLAPDFFSKLIMGLTLVLGAILWCDETIQWVRKH